MKKPQVALVGAGYWGKNLARNFQLLGALHTLCDSRDETLRGYGEEYKSVAKETSFAAVLANPSVTAVAIATPSALHYELADAAISAEKDVYVEKPLCLKVSDARNLIDRASAAKRILMVGHLLQFHGVVRKLGDMIERGELGRLLYITSNRLNLGKARKEENSLWSFAPHDISVILGFAGEMPESVTCHGASYLTARIADTTLTQMRFPSGLQAHIHVSWLNPFKEQRLTVVGTDGMAVFDDTKPWNEKLVVYRNYLTWLPGNLPLLTKTDGEPVVVKQTEPLTCECQHFLDCCEKRTRPRTDGVEGFQVLQVLHAAELSMNQDGKKVAPFEASRSVSSNHRAHPTATIDDTSLIGSGSSIWHYSHVSAGAELGEGCSLGQNVFIAPTVKIGSNVKIQNNVSVYAGTTIEDDVFLGPSCVLTNVSNPRSEVIRRGLYEETLIRHGATIGANATIVCGVTIGRFAFVAAGAVVTKDIPDYGYVRGVPAKQVGWMSRHGHPLEFDECGIAKCPESQLLYLQSVAANGVPEVRCTSIAENTELPNELRVGKVSYRQVGNSPPGRGGIS